MVTIQSTARPVICSGLEDIEFPPKMRNSRGLCVSWRVGICIGVVELYKPT